MSNLELGDDELGLNGQALVTANPAVGSAQCVRNHSSKNDPRLSVRAPIPITGIFEYSPYGSIQCKVYKLTPSGAVLQSVDNFSTFRAVRRSSGFPRFAYLPAEIRDMIVSLTFAVYLQDAPPFQRHLRGAREYRRIFPIPLHLPSRTNYCGSGSAPCLDLEP
jgi:hypothetical protein